MIFPALMEAADRGRLLLVDGGLCRFHVRRDGVTVIRELIVLPERRRDGIGRHLVERIITRTSMPVGTGGALLARCPVACESNGFWERLRFTKGAVTRGCQEWWHRG